MAGINEGLTEEFEEKLMMEQKESNDYKESSFSDQEKEDAKKNEGDIVEDEEMEALQKIMLALRREHELFKSFTTFLLAKLVKIDAIKSEESLDVEMIDQLETEIAHLVIEVADRIVDDELLQEEEFKLFREKIFTKIQEYPQNETA
ncbi:unnamed protein product [Dimorphilus gyrociliatus]|uniref:Uncharacterized protein n=1 Tax=Dimorphilus gyrociliatus TaxID=2664684 RepID=A0A7I8VDP5_9ANNE|nr:unnamed protein product [Dimorphilus gyrociliatus]